METFGTIYSEILTNDLSVPHEFHVVSDNFGVPSDGIIGRDSIKNHRCTIDYESTEMTFKYNNNVFSFEIFDSIKSDTNILPPRGEVFRNFKIQNFNEPKFIQNSEIEEVIFIANTLAYNETVNIRILNTNNETKII